MPINRLKGLLDKEHIPYGVIEHTPAYTAQGIASSAHISGKELAKIVMIKIDGKMAMAVLPANCKMDFTLLKKALKAKKIELAHEDEFKNLFPDCEAGAMPPFGNLYDLETVVSEELSEDEEIAFNAGSHKELIRMKFKDYNRLVHPKFARF